MIDISKVNEGDWLLWVDTRHAEVRVRPVILVDSDGPQLMCVQCAEYWTSVFPSELFTDSGSTYNALRELL